MFSFHAMIQQSIHWRFSVPTKSCEDMVLHIDRVVARRMNRLSYFKITTTTRGYTRPVQSNRQTRRTPLIGRLGISRISIDRLERIHAATCVVLRLRSRSITNTMKSKSRAEFSRLAATRCPFASLSFIGICPSNCIASKLTLAPFFLFFSKNQPTKF